MERWKTGKKILQRLMSEGTKQGAKNISSYLRAIEDSKNI